MNIRPLTGHGIRRTPRVHALPPGAFGAATLPRDVFAAHAHETRRIVAHGRNLDAIGRAVRMDRDAFARVLVGTGAVAVVTCAQVLAAWLA